MQLSTNITKMENLSQERKFTKDFIMRQDECKTVNKALVELLIKGISSKYLITEYESKLILNLRLVFTVGSIKMQHF